MKHRTPSWPPTRKGGTRYSNKNLRVMSTHGIVAAFENLQQRLEKRRVEKKDLRKAQEDLCWLQNELDNRLSEDHKGREKRLRKDRRAAKEEYAKQRNDG